MDNSLEARVSFLVRFSSCGISRFIFTLLASHTSARFTCLPLLLIPLSPVGVYKWLGAIFLWFVLGIITSSLIFFPLALVPFCGAFAPSSRVVFCLLNRKLDSLVSLWVVATLFGSIRFIFFVLSRLLSLHLLLCIL